MNKLFQVATLQALSLGALEGVVSYGEIKQLGDIGLGTFDGMDGEMIMLDGDVFRADVNGDIYAVDDEAMAPFACVATFTADKTMTIMDSGSFDDLARGLNVMIPASEKNLFHAARIVGNFKSITYRSIAKQERPYPSADKINPADRKSYTDTDASGFLVALRSPEYMDGLNFAGWHIHYISRDFTRGGHVLDVKVADADAEICTIEDYEIRLPKGGFFNNLNLSEIDPGIVEGLEKE